MNTIKIVRKGDKWAPIVNGKQLKALGAIEVCMALEAFTQVVNQQNVEAPAEFWEEVKNAPYQGGVD